MVDFVHIFFYKIHQNVTIKDQTIEFCSRLDQNAFQKILRGLKKVSLKSFFADFFFLGNFFFYKMIWNVCNKMFMKTWAKKIMLGRLRPPKSPSSWGASSPTMPQTFFELNPHGQLVIGYHWLAFLNQVRKN